MKNRNKLFMAVLATLQVTVCHGVAGASEFAVRTFLDICTVHKSNDAAIEELEKQRQWRLLNTDINERGRIHHFWNSANGSNLRPRTGSTVVVFESSGNNERCSVGVYNRTLASILRTLKKVAKVGELEKNELGYSVYFTIPIKERVIYGELFTRTDRWWFMMVNRTRPKQISSALR